VPSQAKPRKSGSSRSTSSRNGSSPSKRSSSKRSSSARSSSARSSSSRGRAASSRSKSSGQAKVAEHVPGAEAIEEKVSSMGGSVDAIAEKARHGAGMVAKGAAAAGVGTAAAALAGRALIMSRRRKRVLGVPIPRTHRGFDMKQVAKQVAGVAERVERQSSDISRASGRAKQAAQMLT
jgi:hypothetical protein